MSSKHWPMYSSSRYQMWSSLDVEAPKHHADDGTLHIGAPHSHEDYTHLAFGNTAEHTWICDVLHRGLRQDLCNVLACLADALTGTRQCCGQHAHNLTRVAQLLTEVHHIQRMGWHAVKLRHSLGELSLPSKQTTDRAPAQLKQDREEKVLPPGLKACPIASRAQPKALLQTQTDLPAAKEHLSLTEDPAYARGIKSTQACHPHAPDSDSVRSRHTTQKRAAQRTALFPCSSRKDMPSLERKLVSAEHCPDRHAAGNVSIFGSDSTTQKSVGTPHQGQGEHAVSMESMAGAYQQSRSVRTPAPLNTRQLSASLLVKVAGHLEAQTNRPSSAGLAAPYKVSYVRPGTSRPAWDDSVITPATRADLRSGADFPVRELPERPRQLTAQRKPKPEHPWLSKRATVLRNSRNTPVLTGARKLKPATAPAKAGHVAGCFRKTEHEGRTTWPAEMDTAGQQPLMKREKFLRQLDSVQSSMHRIVAALEQCLD